MKTYCAAAFTQIYADNASRYRLCCHAGVHPELSKYNTNNINPFEYFFSDEIEQIREDMMLGKKIKGCEGCYKLEEQGGKSWRQWKYNKIYDLRADVHRVNLKLRIMGSFCNLGCYMCYPYNSSTRRKHLKETGAQFENESIKFVSTGTKRFEETIKDILENIELVESMNITGGEPLQLDRMWKFTDAIPPEHAKNITINFDTNLTQLEYKQWNVWGLIDKFKEVRFGVSCDHFGDKLAWIRYPIDVQQFEKNLETVKDYVSNINVTVSMLNILDLNEIQEYYKSFNTTFYGIVQAPQSLSIKNIPNKELLIEKYKDLDQMIVNELNKPANYKELHQGIEYCRHLNSTRNINFDKVFENFFNYLGETYKINT